MARSWLKISWAYAFLITGFLGIDLAVAGDGAYAVRACSYEIRAKSNELPSEPLPVGQNYNNAHLETRGLGFDTSKYLILSVKNFIKRVLRCLHLGVREEPIRLESALVGKEVDHY